MTAPTLREALERVLLNGVQHFKNEFGKCYITCTGCPTESEARAALAAPPEHEAGGCRDDGCPCWRNGREVGRRPVGGRRLRR